MTKAEKTRQFIIEKAAFIINKKGMLGTSITDVMEATKLAKGGIYGNFSSKDEICVEAFNFLSRRLSTAIDLAISAKLTPKAKLLALLDYYHDVLVLGDTGGCPLLNFGTEADDTNKGVKLLVAKAVKATQQRFSRLIEDGKTQGEFSSAVDADVFAVKMFTLIEGAIFTCRIANNKSAMKIVVDILKKEIESFSI